ncbi:MAG TPA: helix-turn-helix transcriptional regulator [Saprospiraceae bacterium]|nr:helix-turn-helix transcriptional regulator [Saprospiraceae bacterium]
MKTKQIKKTKASKKSKPILGPILKEAREKMGLNITQVSNMYNVSGANISYIESGRIKCPNAKLLYKLSLLYKLKLEDLILVIED